MVEPSGTSKVTVTPALQLMERLSFMVGVFFAVAVSKVGCFFGSGVTVASTVSPTTKMQLSEVFSHVWPLPLTALPSATVRTWLSAEVIFTSRV